MPPTPMRLRELTIRYTIKKDPEGLPISIDEAKISTPSAAATVFLPLFQDEPAEVFGVLLLSAKHRVIGYHEVGRGTVQAVLVQPREILQAALLANAAALIVGHCHPSGDPTPSADDVAVTRRLVEAGELMGIEILDHIITGDARYVSLRETSTTPPSPNGGLRL
jgi:DNA repair protein RadC